MYIEIEFQNKEITQEENQRNRNLPYHVARQPALMFHEGEGASKHPFHFELRLYYGTDPNKANSIQAVPAGKYRLKDSAFTVNGFKNASCDFSELQPMHMQQKSS